MATITVRNEAGKGSRVRPYDHAKFRENFERIFGTGRKRGRARPARPSRKSRR